MLPQALISPLLCGAIAAGAGIPGPANTPRAPLHSPPTQVSVERLVFKCRDAAKIRLSPAGELISLSGSDTSSLDSFVETHALDCAPMIRLAPSELAQLEMQAEALSGRPQPDLAGFFHADAAPGANLQQLALSLAALENVEWADVEVLQLPPPSFGPHVALSDFAPPTPNYSGQQDYVGADPGVAADGAYLTGYTGQGVRLSHIEYGWIATHEDLVDVDLHPEPGQTPPGFVETFGYDDHGTASVGMTTAPWNNYGIDGLAPDAEVYTFPEHSVEEGPRRATAILAAALGSEPGDVILLEMQGLGPDGNFCPAEVEPAVHAATRVAVDAGITVVAAAGNGGADLDSEDYEDYRLLGDSGAIIVGGGTPDVLHDTAPTSTFGSRVNVQGWDSDALSLGYGDFALLGDDPNQSYTLYGGTSAAAAMTAGAAVLIQSYAKDALGIGTSSENLRRVLAETGVPQGVGPYVGPMPDVVAAIGRYTSSWSDVGFASQGVNGTPLLSASGLGWAETPYRLRVANAAPDTAVTLVVGYGAVFVPIFGGVLVPSLDILIAAGVTDSSGALTLDGQFPATLVPGALLWFQVVLPDPAATLGFAATNALALTAE